MKKIQQIWNHPVYQDQFWKLQEAERTRTFCNHTLVHFLDVARIAHILNLENNYGIPKEVIYAAALLHDIGRCAQYTDGTPHEEAGARFCAQIMPECGFSAYDTECVQNAILNHRGIPGPGDSAPELLSACLYRADKLSRNCFVCPAASDCNWDEQKRNLSITI